MRDAMFKSSSLPIRLNCFLGLFSRSIANLKRTVHACPTTGSGYSTRCYTKLTSAICGSRMETTVPQGLSEVLAEVCGSGYTQQWWLLILSSYTRHKRL
ncbi:hypothetical protein TNCV_2706111 [Trichonephila clavipes]|nr:hypothetical protein TNCV_2706111 [Trichonephila clavipes]